MESVSSSEIGALDLSFGLNDPNFSDRTLLLDIIDHADSYDAPSTIDTTSTPQPQEKAIRVSRLILAARSPFFLKLFSNGMQESEQKHVTLRIEASEEVSFMDLLKYVYSNNLPTTLDALWDLLLIADKFDVDSCLRDCTRSLLNFPIITCKLACDYLILPQSLLMSPIVQPMIDAAKKFLVTEFQNLQKFKEEVLDLPLLGLQAVLSSDNLQVLSEFAVYDYVLKWARGHYIDLDERREILKTHLLHLVRFPFMTTKELTEDVQDCSDIDPELASEIVIHALSFKAETNSHRKRSLATEEVSAASHQFVERAYIYRLVKVVELELPRPYCVVYLDLTRNDLNSIFPDGEVWSESIHLGGQELSVGANCYFNPTSNQHDFVLALEALDSSTCTVKIEFSVRRKPDEDFESWFKGSHKFTETLNVATIQAGDWTRLTSYDSPYFFNDILHVRAELSIM